MCQSRCISERGLRGKGIWSLSCTLSGSLQLEVVWVEFGARRWVLFWEYHDSSGEHVTLPMVLSKEFSVINVDSLQEFCGTMLYVCFPSWKTPLKLPHKIVIFSGCGIHSDPRFFFFSFHVSSFHSFKVAASIMLPRLLQYWYRQSFFRIE